MSDPDTTLEYWKILDIMFNLRTRRPSLVPRLRLSLPSSREGSAAAVVQLPEALEGLVVVEEPPNDFGLQVPRRPARPGILESLPVRIKDGALELWPGGLLIKGDISIPARRLRLELRMRF